MIINTQWGTSIDEVDAGVFRISTPVPPMAFPGGFSFNQYLIVDEQPLLFHTGLRRMFPLLCEAVAKVIPVNTLRYLGFSHLEADESGALNELLAAAPNATAVCSAIAAQVSVNDLADRPPIGMLDGQTLSLGQRTVRWIDAPHMPHAWECGYLFEETQRVLLCGDLLTQGGHQTPARTESPDVLDASEVFREMSDYYSHTRRARPILERLAATDPALLACMHGSAFSGDGARLLRALAEALDPEGQPSVSAPSPHA